MTRPFIEITGLTKRYPAAKGGEPLTVACCRQYGALTVRALPFLSSRDYDALLALCDVNFVRGEDSFVRAQWAAQAFVWHVYPQSDDVHLRKMTAFLDRYCERLADADALAMRALWQAWNTGGQAHAGWAAYASRTDALGRHARRWCDQLAGQEDLATRLVKFVDNAVK